MQPGKQREKRKLTHLPAHFVICGGVCATCGRLGDVCCARRTMGATRRCSGAGVRALSPPRYLPENNLAQTNGRMGSSL